MIKIDKQKKTISSNPLNHNHHCSSSSCRHRKTSCSAAASSKHLKTYTSGGDRHVINSANASSNSNKTNTNVPSRWYTVLALPFPDQKLGRRDINTFGRGVYSSRAGFFSNPLWFEMIKNQSNHACHNNYNPTRTSHDLQM